MSFTSIRSLSETDIFNSILVVQNLNAALFLCVALVKLVKHKNKVAFAEYAALSIFVAVETLHQRKLLKNCFVILLITKLMIGFQTYMVDLAWKGRVHLELKLRENEPRFLSTKTVALFAGKNDFIDHLFIWKKEMYYLITGIYLSVFMLCPAYARALVDMFSLCVALCYFYKKALPTPAEKKEADWKKEVLLLVSETVGFVVTYWSYPDLLCYFDLFLLGIFALLFSSILTLSFILIRRFVCEPVTHSI